MELSLSICKISFRTDLVVTVIDDETTVTICLVMTVPENNSHDQSCHFIRNRCVTMSHFFFLVRITKYMMSNLTLMLFSTERS